MKRRPGEHKIKFTPELWNKWLRRRDLDEKTVTLREGISEFRALLAKHERFRV